MKSTIGHSFLAAAADGVEMERNNIFGPAKGDELFQGHGRADIHAPISVADTQGGPTTRGLMERLAIKMSKSPSQDYIAAHKGFKPDPNDNIPAGHTYLGQIIAHDLVHNIAPVPALDQPGIFRPRDLRDQRLILDTLYGGGPFADPHLYAFKPVGAQGIRMRLGYAYAPGATTRDKFVKNDAFETGILSDQPPRDIPRMSCPFAHDQGHLGEDGKSKPGFTNVLLADSRNDDHLIISQLTAFFLALHNIIADALAARIVQGGHASTGDLQDYRDFLHARRVTTLVYRRIVLNDFLSRLLDKEIFDMLQTALSGCAEAGPKDYLRGMMKTGGPVPVEFSHAVYRFGHAQIQAAYPLNDSLENGGVIALHQILSRTSSNDSYRTPISSDWLVDWKIFFPMEGEGRPTSSARIRPHSVAGTSIGRDRFLNPDDVTDGGLFYLDLLRGARVGVRSVKSVVGSLPKAIQAKSSLMASDAIREKKVRAWLEDEPSDLSPDDINVLASDPPLFLYTLFEAAHDKKGERLGVVGSSIVAGVFLAAFQQSRSCFEGDANLVMNTEALFDEGIPASMGELISFVKSNGGLSEITYDNRHQELPQRKLTPIIRWTSTKGES